MITIFYMSTFVISLILSLVYTYMWHKHFDIHFTLIFLMCPLCNLGYVYLSEATTIEEAVLATKIFYIGGCFLILFMTLLIANLCKIMIHPFLRATMMVISLVVYLSVMTIGKTDLFYTSDTTFTFTEAGLHVEKHYGPMHTVFLIMTVLYFIVGLTCLIYSHALKRNISRKIIHLLYFAEAFAGLCYITRFILKLDFDLMPLSYVAAQFTFLLIVYRTGLYDLSDSAIDSLVHKGVTGFVSFDFKYNYLGCNDTAMGAFPELNELTVDMSADNCDFIRTNFVDRLSEFEGDSKKDSFFIRRDSKVWRCDINYLYDGRRKRGYQFIITDDTKDQEHIDLLNQFNTKLNEEVRKKTAHISEMHDKLILSMATMVESRDNSTGGHIMRTSEGVRMIVAEINKDGSLMLSKTFCRNIIKAAPMHDLGKIAVRDSILTKNGRFTDEEYDEMKTHAAEGAKIVHRILEGTDDEEFRKTAENVAHYHHERWDGRGYPEGLKGEEIPLEARIMAIADVYDALVSKRVYKEKMSFEEADSIIMQGMGTQFDKSLEPFYVAARPKLEKYYSNLPE